MSPAAADTLYTHFKETGLSPSDYDLIVTGDLGTLGSRIMKDLIWEKGFDVEKQHEANICIGFEGKGRVKIQFTTRENAEKVEIETEPSLLVLSKGEACEFHIRIKSFCTLNYEDDISLTALIMSKGETVVIPIKIKFSTKLSSKLDPDELIQERKLGEGSFGIVFLGTYRGNKVAIKKMKDAAVANTVLDQSTKASGKEKKEKRESLNKSNKSSNPTYSSVSGDSEKPKEIVEFEKEVAMLDKFRNDYVIHFYGAVMIPNKICMVTEFAQYGSLQDLIVKSKRNVEETMRIKLCLDASKGIRYLHGNGVLHRDIKPDNFLVVSLEDNVTVNCKLTDFGASRNVNMMMTNMTFTKGIGTPAYMAPEILNREKYKTAADIYSFAITMLEVMTWRDAFPKEIYKYAWDIADCISCGRRPSSIDEIDDENIKSIIEKSWVQEPKERLEIGEIVDLLENAFGKRRGFTKKNVESSSSSEKNENETNSVSSEKSNHSELLVNEEMKEDENENEVKEVEKKEESNKSSSSEESEQSEKKEDENVESKSVSSESSKSSKTSSKSSENEEDEEKESEKEEVNEEETSETSSSSSEEESNESESTENSDE